MPDKPAGLIDEALDFAIEREEEAARFYGALAARARQPEARRLLEQLSAEERGHKAKLQAIRAGHTALATVRQVPSLRISDWITAAPATEDMGYADALVLAMKREKASYRLYADLAAATEDPELRNVFLALAQEEAAHKLRFELEYDDEVLREN